MRSLFKVGGYVLSFLLVLVIGFSISAELQAQDTLEFEDAEIRVEVNSTDGDAGLQLFADGEPWQRVRVTGPDGRQVYSVSNRGKLSNGIIHRSKIWRIDIPCYLLQWLEELSFHCLIV